MKLKLMKPPSRFKEFVYLGQMKAPSSIAAGRASRRLVCLLTLGLLVVAWKIGYGGMYAAEVCRFPALLRLSSSFTGDVYQPPEQILLPFTDFMWMCTSFVVVTIPTIASGFSVLLPENHPRPHRKSTFAVTMF